MFEVIPVLDLLGGQVVHARAGQRDLYRPLQSPLAADSTPEAVLDGLLGLHPFRSVYVADLDAIRGQGDHRALLRRLSQTYRNVRIWVDAAFRGRCECRGFLGADIGELVLGSESQVDTRMVEELADADVILSLDYQGDRPLGPPALFETPSLWPARIIVMTLAAVGMGGGPDLDRLRAVLAKAGERKVYAAGGVRNGADLDALKEIGCAGVLVATALHDGRLTAADLI